MSASNIKIMELEEKIERYMKKIEKYKADIENIKSETNSIVEESSNTTVVGNLDYKMIQEYTDKLQRVETVMCAKARCYITRGQAHCLIVKRDSGGMVIGFQKDNVLYQSPTAAYTKLFNNRKEAGPHRIFFKNGDSWIALKDYK